MSKVQEAINKMRAKMRPNLALSAQLRIPSQQPHSSSLFPVEPAAVKSWLITHGAFKTTASIKTLTRALQHCNRTVISPNQRLLIMQEFEKPFANALQSLDALFLYLDFPMPKDAENAFQAASVLCQEMAYGYKIVLVDSIQGRGKIGKTQKHQALFLSMEHLTNQILRHSKTYREWPAEVWYDANTLHWMAKIDRIEMRKDNQQINPLSDKPLSVTNQYARLCGLYLLNYNQYQAQELQVLFTRLSSHSDEITFETTMPADFAKSDTAQMYCVGDRNPPAPAQFCHYENNSRLLYFSLDNLHQKLNASPQEAGAQSYNKTINHPATQNRKDSRAPRAASIRAATGMKDIHTAIRSAPPSEQVESQFTDLHQLMAGNGNETLPKTTQLNTVQADYGAEFIIKDQSKGGYGLICEGSGSAKLQIGELIAHSYQSNNNEHSWHVAVIRWLKTANDKTLHLGIETITRHGNAVEISRLQKGRETSVAPVEGLLANYRLTDSQAKMLLLPLHMFKPGETVGYRDSNGFHMVKLIESVNLNGNFQCFAVIAVSSDFENTDPLQANVQQPAHSTL